MTSFGYTSLCEKDAHLPPNTGVLMFVYKFKHGFICHNQATYILHILSPNPVHRETDSHPKVVIAAYQMIISVLHVYIMLTCHYVLALRILFVHSQDLCSSIFSSVHIIVYAVTCSNTPRFDRAASKVFSGFLTMVSKVVVLKPP